MEKKIALVPLLLLVGVVAAIVPDYVPDTGYYYIDKGYTYSSFTWDEEWATGNLDPEAYEHEFRVENTGFAQYAGYWSSNLPQDYLDLEDDSQSSANTWDEFVVGSDDAEALVAGQEYSMYIALSDQDSSITNSRTILEAERNRDFPLYNDPLEWYTIKDFSAPDSGTWDFSSTSSTSSTKSVEVQSDSAEDRKSYIDRRKEVLNRLARKMPEKKMQAIVSLSKFTDARNTDAILRNYTGKTKAVWFESPGYGFSGGFVVEGTVTDSLNRELEDLKDDTTRARGEVKNADQEKKQMLKKLVQWQEINIRALSEGEVKFYGVELKGKLKELQRLQGNSRVTLVDVRYYPDAPKGANVVQRPLEPER